MFRTMKWQSFLIALVYIAGGAGLLFFTQKVEPLLIDLIGIALIAIGVVHIIGYLVMDIENAVYRNDFITGIVMMLVGGLVIYQKKTFREMIPLILALMIIVSGFFKIQDGIDTHRMGYSFGAAFGLAAVSVIIGALVMFNVITDARMVNMVLGGGLLYSGITDLFDSVYVSGKLRRYIRELEEEDEEPEPVQTPYQPQPQPETPDYTLPQDTEIRLEHQKMEIPSYEDPADDHIELTLDPGKPADDAAAPEKTD